MKKQKRAIEKLEAWDGEFESIEAFFETVQALGRSAWAELEREIEQLSPSEMLALALLLATLPQNERPTTLSQKDTGKVRVVLGDAVIKGNVSLSGAQWLVTGDLRVEGTLADDETTRIAIAHDLHAQVVETEGDLWVGHDATVTRSTKATYEAGAFVVVGTLRTPKFVERDHVVEIGKRIIGKK